MKTELMLLLQTDGRPTMTLAECAALLNVQTNTMLNRIYAKRVPFAMFQLEGGTEWHAHVSDVAAYIDKQRDAAKADLAASAAGESSSSNRAADRPATRAHERRGRRIVEG